MTSISLCAAFLLVTGFVANAQDSAIWVGPASGNWGTAANWLCSHNGVSTGACVPGAGFDVSTVNGNITLDIDTGVNKIFGGGSFTINNHTLVATNAIGLQITGPVSITNNSAIDAQVSATTLVLQSSVVTENVTATTATIGGSSTGDLNIAVQLNAANSSFGSGSNLQLLQTSSLTNSTIGGMFRIDGGASLKLDTGSIVNSTSALVGSGDVTIQGASTWTQTGGAFFVGVAPGAADLHVSGAGSALNLTGAALELGQIATSVAIVEKGGSIAATGTGGNLFIGLGVGPFVTDAGLLVQTGGTVSANVIQVAGNSNGSTALLSVQDAGSSVTAAGELRLVSGGRADVFDQASLTADSLRIQDGIMTVTAGGTLTLVSDTVTLIGSTGNGTLKIQTGGTATGPGSLILGGNVGATGAVLIDGFGSSWNGTNSISVGEMGQGTLTVQNNGLLQTGADANGVSGSIGTQSSGVGVATIQSGGDWKAGGTLQIGAAGTGTLTLQGGTVESGDGVLGLSSGSMGTVNVSGAGSKWTVAGDLTVGSAGAGVLAISAGGLVSAVNGVIGDKQGSGGTVTILGLGSGWQNGGLLTVGGDGGASLTVDTGFVTAGGAAIGSNLAPVSVTLTNHGSMSILGDLTIGGGAVTDVLVENGATLDSGDHADVGGSGGDTTVTITDPGSAWTLHGAGLLTIDDQGTVLVQNGGTLTAGTITVNTGGTLNGMGGTIIGNLVNAGGMITPGDATGIMTVSGNYTQTAGTLLFEIDGLGPGQFDRLLISGLANLSGGFIDIDFGNGFVPAAGQTFDLLSAALGLTVGNVTFEVIGLPQGLVFTDSVGPNGFTLNFASAAPQSAPEPAAGALLALGLAGLLGRRRRRCM